MRPCLTMLLAALLAGGCAMIPEYQRPEPGVPETWPDGPAYGGVDGDTAELPPSAIGWRDFFVDPQLETLIESALDNNSDVRIAALEVARVRARYRVQEAELLPQVDAEGSYTRQHSPESFSGSGASAGGSAATSGQGGTFDYYRAGVGVTSYELDLFGRIRSLERQALEQYFATREARRSTQIALIAEVANAYFNLLADRALLNLAEKTLAAQRESLQLVRQRFEVGASSELDVRQAQTAVETARADVARFRRLTAQDRNALVELVGRPVSDDLLAKASFEAPKTGTLPDSGLPSELLLRRPDVLQAEHELRAANANIGAARAAFFPSISLTGSYGSVSSDVDGLFGSGTTSWSFTPQISVPIFDGGRNEANLDVAEVSRKIEVARYRQTVRGAFREVADALAARGALGDELAARRELVAAARASHELSRKRYRQGIESYLPVLDSQRALYDARQALLNAELAELSNRVTLYKVLGGGWRAQTGEPRESAPPAAKARETGGTG